MLPGVKPASRPGVASDRWGWGVLYPTGTGPTWDKVRPRLDRMMRRAFDRSKGSWVRGL
jgi:hypothetical protein